ncbi:hypothetical protein NDU88_006238 [Pleurodeles waltl]|uniref:Uncharacterized protein n=1 Tax=Pleurodeles waltl TaxID=8319 RepID=A0AAV7LQA3_PLEWA|nr:hypothetical protein NDU88_006238 [Pleurodeles waltl]
MLLAETKQKHGRTLKNLLKPPPPKPHSDAQRQRKRLPKVPWKHVRLASLGSLLERALDIEKEMVSGENVSDLDPQDGEYDASDEKASRSCCPLPKRQRLDKQDSEAVPPKADTLP